MFLMNVTLKISHTQGWGGGGAVKVPKSEKYFIKSRNYKLFEIKFTFNKNHFFEEKIYIFRDTTFC